jgi:hypothetical protein
MARQSDELRRQQAEWYRILEKNGFEDIEDHSHEDKPLKRWSGIPAASGIIDAITHQEAGSPIQSSFPEKRFVKEERLLNHPEFEQICVSICSHGNHKLNSVNVRQIWELYLEGATNRGIAKTVSINHVTVYRCIANLTKWAEAMGEEPEVSTVRLREFDRETDSPMLFSTWRNALWFDKEDRDETKNHAFFRSCTRLIKMIISNPATQVRVACLSDDLNLILGVAVVNKDNLIWVYVKADYRGRGIATLLAKGTNTVANPSTRVGKAIVKEKGLKVHDGQED